MNVYFDLLRKDFIFITLGECQNQKFDRVEKSVAEYFFNSLFEVLIKTMSFNY